MERLECRHFLEARRRLVSAPLDRTTVFILVVKSTINDSAVLAGSLFQRQHVRRKSMETGDFLARQIRLPDGIQSRGHQSMCLLVYMSNLTDLTNPLFDLRSHTMNEGLPAGCLATLPAAVTGATSLSISHPAHIAKGSAGLVGSCA